LGFTHILAYDHVLSASPDRPEGWQGPYTHKDPFHEVFCLFSFMAAVTAKIEFTTGVLILPQRQTALVAKQAAELDVLSGGRLRLGVGLGWNWVEYLALNRDFSKRGKRIEEQITLMRKLWTEPLVTYQSEKYHIPDAGLNPMPVQRPIPVWFGGHHDNVLRRVGTMGDGWMPGFQQAEKAVPSLEKIAAYAEVAGRDPAKIGIEPRMMYGEANPDIWYETMKGWQEAGATHLSLNTMYNNFDTPDKHMQAVRHFADTIGLGA